ncbi:MurR/RpiR family transcriptional regulator [Methylobacterium platani]|uniref:RpiR family transcriptional regulator n=1 Tax=Methylobacterium platani TaxID=427683 RepID=A0A179S9E9_9HYPH|nr:MurR/RpiR family transcriptional regulator [Methylobacterium platani]OAS24418.1 hypothetical protein A5481_14140 [Methylobacterium platani]
MADAPPDARGAEAPPSTDLLRTLRDTLDGLPETQARIARMIVADPEWAVQTGVELLAERAGVSAPTIVRFARAVGCEGVRDMKLKLAGSLALGTPYVHRSVRPTDAPGEVVRNVVGSVTSMLAEWQSSIDPARIEEAVAAIRTAGRVDTAGTGATSHFLAHDLHARLFRLGIPSNSFADTHLQLTAASCLTRGDVLVAISYVGRMPALLRTVAVARRAGATVVAITRTGTPLHRAADILLAVDVPGDATMRVGTDATIAQLIVIEILSVRLGLALGGRATSRLAAIHDLLQSEQLDSDDAPALGGG